MKAVTWQGKRDVRVEDGPGPRDRGARPTSIVRITTTGICGSDLHLYEVLGPFLDAGDILGHEPMGIVRGGRPEVDRRVAPGDRVVIPFNISCGTCWMCGQGLQSQCETTQVREQGTGASLFGYTKLYGQVPGGQAEYLRVPFGNTCPIKVPEGPPDDRFVFLSDVLPTAWQAVRVRRRPARRHAGRARPRPDRRHGGRIALHQGVEQVIGVDLVPERLERARAHGVDGARPERARRRPGRRRARAHRRPGPGRGHRRRRHGGARRARRPSWRSRWRRCCPDAVARKVMETAGIDRLDALYTRDRPGPPRRHDLADRRLRRRWPTRCRCSRCSTSRCSCGWARRTCRRWVDDILPLLTDDDPLGVDGFATHHLPLDEAPEAYEIFQKKQDGAVKVLLHAVAGRSRRGTGLLTMHSRASGATTSARGSARRSRRRSRGALLRCSPTGDGRPAQHAAGQPAPRGGVAGGRSRDRCTSR